jgi:hypothetical protein
MKLIQFSHQNGPKNLSRITRENGTGFILFRLLEMKEATKSEVYGYDVQTGSHGTHNYIWAILLNSGLIECSNGYRKPSKRACFGGYTDCYATYTYKKEPARYRLTVEGEKIARTL